MHSITGTTPRSFVGASQAVGTNSSSGANFQLSALAGQSSQSIARGISSTASSSLGPQTVSTLLQAQDLSQTQARGGHGAGGHHGSMKMMSNLEAEEVEEGEEAQILRSRKKLTKEVKSVGASETAEVDENGAVTEGAGEAENSEQNEKSDQRL